MNITIIGRHPELEYGFNGTMSLNWIQGFFKNGCKVELLLPQSSVHHPCKLLNDRGYKDYDQLPRYGGDFDIRMIKSADEIHSNCDVVIWQTYRAEENYLLNDLRRKNFLVTKNHPRVFTGNKDLDQLKSKKLLHNFDLIALSLLVDEKISKEINIPHEKFSYVPRGFDTNLLTGLTRSECITIGLDRPVKAGFNEHKAIEHIIKIANNLKTFKKIDYLSMRQRVVELDSTKIPNLKFNEFYDQFINKLWIYLPIDFKYSIHNKGFYLSNDNSPLYLGLYENQIIETQIAGGLVVARSGDIPSELLMLPNESFVNSYEDHEIMTKVIIDHLENFESRSNITKLMATQRHDRNNSALIYLEAIKKLI